ncbi:hypothetical protein DXG03_005413 [Asterophora parasitica]|uniref:ADF-H domain-containing protein n=1 Tax=Asterophora parasitica TaxID=117018 RepID=A0A9P7KCM3_9AGAR|nr:hypothetical protein DXG03_005413 [Asterophora parasitica]
MALNLADPGAIVAAYEAIIDIHNTNNWLLLQYTKFDELALFDNGSGGLRELKHSIENPEQVHIGFYREEESSGGELGFVVINYIPPSIPAVKKARALVHSRRVGAVFKVRDVYPLFSCAIVDGKHQTTLTVDDLEQLTPDAVRNALNREGEPDSPRTSTSTLMGRAAPASNPTNTNTHTINTRARSRTTGSPPNKTKTLPSDPTFGAGAYTTTFEPVRRAAEAPDALHSYQNHNPEVGAPPMGKSASMFSNFIRRKKKTDSADEGSDDAWKPPTPPKDKGHFNVPPLPPLPQHPQHQQRYPPQQHQRQGTYPPLVPVRGPGQPSYDAPQPSRTLNWSGSEHAVLSHAGSSNLHNGHHRGHSNGGAPPPPDEFGGLHGELGRWQQDYGQSRVNLNGYGSGNADAGGSGGPIVMSMSLPLKGKWAAEPMDLEERLRKTQEERRQRLEEAKAAREEEERFREEKKRRKEKELWELDEATRRMRAAIEEEKRQFLEEKRRREQMEREEEERRQAEITESRRLDRERRAEENRRAEETRRALEKNLQEKARREEEKRKTEEVERMKKVQLAATMVKRNRNIDQLVSGSVTIQSHDSLVWKRRFFKFIETSVYLYRSKEDAPHYLDKIELRGNVRGILEWNEGHEELEAIPHSFALEFADGSHWSLFSDSEEEKITLLGLLHLAAGL